MTDIQSGDLVTVRHAGHKFNGALGCVRAVEFVDDAQMAMVYFDGITVAVPGVWLELSESVGEIDHLN